MKDNFDYNVNSDYHYCDHCFFNRKDESGNCNRYKLLGDSCNDYYYIEDMTRYKLKKLLERIV